MCWKILHPYHINILKQIPSPSENINDCLRSKFRGVKLCLTRLSMHTCLTPKCMLVLLEFPSGHLGMKTKQISKLDVHFILCVCVCVCARACARARTHTKSLQSCPTLCDPRYCSPPGSSVHGILQARILKWVAIPFSRGSSWPMDWTRVSCIAGRFFTIWATKEAALLVTFTTNIFYHNPH